MHIKQQSFFSPFFKYPDFYTLIFTSSATITDLILYPQNPLRYFIAPLGIAVCLVVLYYEKYKPEKLKIQWREKQK